MNLISANADAERACETARSRKLGDEAMTRSLLDNILLIADVNADLIVEGSRRDMNNLMTERADPICPERSQTKDQNQINQSVVNMLQVGSGTAKNGSKTVSMRFLERAIAKIFSHSAAND